MSVVFTGNGNVSDGAKDIFEALPHQYITVSELHSLQYDVDSGKKSANQLYGVQLQTSDLVKRKGKDHSFDIMLYDNTHPNLSVVASLLTPPNYLRSFPPPLCRQGR